MKTTKTLIHALVLLICFSLVSAAALAAEKETAKPTLLVSVSAPPLWDPMWESDVVNEFHARIVTALERAGYQGKISGTTRFDPDKVQVPVLQVTIMQWRPERVGNVQCTFNAGLKTGAKEQSYGIFTGTSPQWLTTASRTWELRRGMDESADAAIKKLVERLRKEGLVPAEKASAD